MNYKGFLKGMATGIAVGAAVAMFADPLTDRQRHRLHKKTEGVFKTVGSMVDNAIDMMK